MNIKFNIKKTIPATLLATFLTITPIRAALYSKTAYSSNTTINGVTLYTQQTATFNTIGATRWSFGNCIINWVSGYYMGLSKGSDNYTYYSYGDGYLRADATTRIYVTDYSYYMTSGLSTRKWAFNPTTLQWK